MNNATYLRKYIIFKTDYLNIPGINPRGHGKIEIRGTKGNINVSIENAQIEEDYIISLLRDRDGQLLEYDLGRIITDHRGRGKADFSLNLKDLEFQGFSMEEINAILIRKGNNILLSGYIHKDNEILNKFAKNISPISEEEKTIIEYDTIEEIDTSIIEPDLDPRDLEFFPEEMTQETIEEKAMKVLEGVIEENLEEVLEYPIEEEGLIEVPPEESKETEYIPKGIEIENHGEVEYTRKLEHKNQMISYILSILRFFPQVEPFKLKIQGYSFWQIEDYGIESYQSFLPYFSYLTSADYKYPFLGQTATCINQIKKHGHYLFGLYEENADTKYYIYGVPGEFIITEHPYRGITGFNTWYEAIDSMGYWLLYIDPMTGEIIYPLNPMVPAY
ncbi:MAG: hypothetical protein GX968_00455 [Tissierellia bacterium]|nr:hypothetical protein [Tissierellia bacterium]